MIKSNYNDLSFRTIYGKVLNQRPNSKIFPLSHMDLSQKEDQRVGVHLSLSFSKINMPHKLFI